MLQHRHGGTLLIIKSVADSEVKSIDRAFARAESPYDAAKDAVERYYATIRPPVSEDGRSFLVRLANHDSAWAFNRIRDSLRSIANLTAMDGAVVITRDYSLLAFGAKITPTGSDRPERILISEPFKNNIADEISMSDWGKGTRHLSAAQFVLDNPTSMALIASQDGTLSFMRWDSGRSLVSVTTHVEYIVE